MWWWRDGKGPGNGLERVQRALMAFENVMVLERRGMRGAYLYRVPDGTGKMMLTKTQKGPTRKFQKT